MGHISVAYVSSGVLCLFLETYQALYRMQWSLGVMLATCDHFHYKHISPTPQTSQDSPVMIVTGHVSRVWHWLARHHANLALLPALFFTKP
jgi:hypothetical protein